MEGRQTIAVAYQEGRESFPNPTTSALTPLPSFVPLLSPLPFNPVTLSHASMGEGGGGSPRDEIETAPAIVGLFYAPRSSPLAKGGGGMKTYILHYLLFGANIRFGRTQAVV